MVKRKLADNLKQVQERIAEACQAAGRSPSEVTLVAVTKYVSPDVIRSLVDLGHEDIGESRVQELTRRAGMLAEWQRRRGHRDGAEEQAADVPRWHLIGHLQRNKVKAVLPYVSIIHSVDSLRLAEEIDAQATRLNRVMPILLQVNAADEAQKFGVAVAAATHLAEQLQTLKHLELRGLMAMAPLTDDEVRIRHTFQRTRELFDEIVGERVAGPAFRELSMGMSSDFEWAIAAGATMVRIGSTLFEGIEQPAASLSTDSD
jgi:pyridoxal phosphate enzyme (YggS family)